MNKIMRNYIKIKIFGLALILFAMFSCDTATQDVSPTISPDNYPLVTFTMDNSSATITEGDTIVYTITLDKMIDRSLTFSVDILDATTMDEDEYTVVPGKMNAFSTSCKLMIITNADEAIETSENLSFQFVINSLAEKYLVNPSTVFASSSFTVNNIVGEDLVLEFGWEADVLIPGYGTYPASANMDFDIYISPNGEFDPADPWASEIGNYDAATGASPEELVLSGWDDGEYVFWFDLYSNGFFGYGATAEVPVSAKVIKLGAINEVVEQDPSKIVTADMAGYVEGGDHNGVVVIVGISGTTYTIKDYTGAVLATGKSVTLKTPRPIKHKM